MSFLRAYEWCRAVILEERDFLLAFEVATFSLVDLDNQAFDRTVPGGLVVLRHHPKLSVEVVHLSRTQVAEPRRLVADRALLIFARPVEQVVLGGPGLEVLFDFAGLDVQLHEGLVRDVARAKVDFAVDHDPGDGVIFVLDVLVTRGVSPVEVVLHQAFEDSSLL